LQEISKNTSENQGITSFHYKTLDSLLQRKNGIHKEEFSKSLMKILAQRNRTLVHDFGANLVIFNLAFADRKDDTISQLVILV
jgi:Ulp1 family protease